MIKAIRCLSIPCLVRWLALGVVVTATGCAHVGPGTSGVQGGAVDHEAIYKAITRDDAAHVRSLVESRAITADEQIPGVGYGSTPMITVAARYASLNVLRYLISAKADLNARTPDNDTALMLAAFFMHEDNDRMRASSDRHDQAVRLLVDAGADMENLGNSYTPLAYAAYSGRDNALRYLIDKGARVNADAQGRMISVNTPLMMATIQGNQNAARYLLRAGADANVRVEGGMSATDFANKYKHEHMMQMLRCAESLRPGEAFSKRCE